MSSDSVQGSSVTVQDSRVTVQGSRVTVQCSRVNVGWSSAKVPCSGNAWWVAFQKGRWREACDVLPGHGARGSREAGSGEDEGGCGNSRFAASHGRDSRGSGNLANGLKQAIPGYSSPDARRRSARKPWSAVAERGTSADTAFGGRLRVCARVPTGNPLRRRRGASASRRTPRSSVLPLRVGISGGVARASNAPQFFLARAHAAGKFGACRGFPGAPSPKVSF